MIRRAAIVLLTLTAVWIAALLLLSLAVPVGTMQRMQGPISSQGVDCHPPSSFSIQDGTLLGWVGTGDDSEARGWSKGFGGFEIGVAYGWSHTVNESRIAAMRVRKRFIRLPLWMPLLPFAIYPGIAFIRGPVRRYRRRRKGLCTRCGYDLTGNVSGTCPECGTEVKQP
jgi:hypothetical protein